MRGAEDLLWLGVEVGVEVGGEAGLLTTPSLEPDVCSIDSTAAGISCVAEGTISFNLFDVEPTAAGCFSAAIAAHLETFLKAIVEFGILISTAGTSKSLLLCLREVTVASVFVGTCVSVNSLCS